MPRPLLYLCHSRSLSAVLCSAMLFKDIFTCEYVLDFTCNTNSYGLVDEATAKVSYTKKDH